VHDVIAPNAYAACQVQGALNEVTCQWSQIANASDRKTVDIKALINQAGTLINVATVTAEGDANFNNNEGTAAIVARVSNSLASFRLAVHLNWQCCIDPHSFGIAAVSCSTKPTPTNNGKPKHAYSQHRRTSTFTK
jgi:hypothetical protein